MAKALKVDEVDLLWSLIHHLKTTDVNGSRLEDTYTGLSFVPGYPTQLESFTPPLIAVDIRRIRDGAITLYGASGHSDTVFAEIYLFAGTPTLGHHRLKWRERANISSDIRAIMKADPDGANDSGWITIPIYSENDESTIKGYAEVESVDVTVLPPTGILEIERFRSNIAVELTVLQDIE